MISPDFSDTRIVPDEQRDAATKAGWQPAYKMLHPNGDKRWVPYNQVDQARKAGYNPTTPIPPPGFQLENPDTSDISQPDASAENPYGGLNESPETSSQASGNQGVSEAAQDIWGALKGVPGAIAHSLPPVAAYDSIKEVIPVLHAFEQARSSGKGIIDSLSAANDQAKQQNAATQALKARMAEFNKNPTQATTRAVSDAAALAMSIYTGGALAEGLAPAEASEIADVAPAEESAAVDNSAPASAPASTSKPGIVQQILKGKNVGQSQAQDAIRQAAKAGSDGLSTVQGNSLRATLDEPIAALHDQAAASYKQLDDAVGFDLKAEKAQLANDQYKLSQLGNTDADVTQRGNLVEAINDSQSRIADAEKTLSDKGIDPRVADQQFQKAKAAEEFRDKVLHNQNVIEGNAAQGQPESVNIDAAIRESQKLMDKDKFGTSRLEQFMGKDNAAKYMSELRRYQQQGIHAVKLQNFAKGVARYAAIGGGLELAHAGIKAATE